MHLMLARTEKTVEGERLADIMSTLPGGRRPVDYTRFHDTQPQEPVRRDGAP